MTLFNRFKRDYINYLISVIIPVLINALSIPVFKRMLGAEKYGTFSLTLNTVLLFTAALSGWITQSVIRHAASATNKLAFFKNVLRITLATQITLSILTFFFVWVIKSELLFALFFSTALFITSVQFCVIAISQALFLSKKNIYSEFFRTSSYLLIAFVLLKISGLNYLYALLTAVIISYTISIIYLLYQTRSNLNANSHSDANDILSANALIKKFVKYGGPLSLWFVFAYMMTLADKYFMLHNAGAKMQGNYQAIFDFTNKSITLILSPVITSLFPLLSSAYENRETAEIRQLLTKILLLEIVALIMALAIYWWIGATILFKIIDVPLENEYKLMGLLCIVGTFIWQLAIVAHKKYELKKRSLFLLAMAIIAFVCQLIFYWALKDMATTLIYPIGFIIAASVYLALVSFSTVTNLLKRRIWGAMPR
jgi:O-antigen/teichoic acid export membrane protein